MAQYVVYLEKRAERDLKGLSPHVIERFRRVFEMLEEDPYRPRPGCDIRVVKGHPRAKAVRVGAYRGLYEVLEDRHEVWFTGFGHRSTIYG